MYIIVEHDDEPGYKETFYHGPYDTLEEAQAVTDAYNEKRVGLWSAWVIERDEMPPQKEWEKKLNWVR